MNWIIFCYFLESVLTAAIPFVVLLFMGWGISCIIVTGNDSFEEWCGSVKQHRRHIVYVILACVSMCILCAICQLPDILVKANLTTLKIRYTDIKTVTKIEAGALEVVEKLDNLIDKGIDRLEGD